MPPPIEDGLLSSEISAVDTMTAPVASAAPRRNRQRWNKVPEVTAFFWVIKVMATTVGETAADFLNTNLNLGLTNTTYIMTALLLLGLYAQIRSRRYIPALYWIAVVLISIVGTLITDNLTDNVGVSLLTTTVVFAAALVVAFTVWYASEGTLSIHTIVTTRRELFYWATILLTFALGTAAGDLTAERLNVGYWRSALLFVGLIGLVATGYYLRSSRPAAWPRPAVHRANGQPTAAAYAVLAFWLAYILTRPLGASLGDYLSQPRDTGGLGLGTVGTSVIFLATILTLVSYLTVTKKDTATGQVQVPTQGWGSTRR